MNTWKELDITAKYAQLNTLRKLSVDISFTRENAIINSIINARINNLIVDLHALYKSEVPEDPSV